MAFTVSNLPAATTAVPGHGVESTIAPKSFDPAAPVGRPAHKPKVQQNRPVLRLQRLNLRLKVDNPPLV